MLDVKLNQQSICQSTPGCGCKTWRYHTVSTYQTYQQAKRWLQERNIAIIVSSEQYTGGYTFKFLCEHEHMIFVLRWT